MKQVSQFVIITSPRSGSYYLTGLLDSASDIVCHGEIFKKNNVELKKSYSDKLNIQRSDIEKRNDAPLKFVRRLRNLTPKKIMGFKTFYRDVSRHKPVVNNVINSADWKKIFLVRNPIETYASLERARITNIWTLHANQKKRDNSAKPVLVTFNRERFENHMKTYQHNLSRNDKLRCAYPESCFALDYKELFDSQKLAQMLKFLGSETPVESLKSDYIKQHTKPLEESFVNYEELQSYLRQSDTGGLTT
ncbi:hypothetical protein [Desulfosediminicola flagellatus]|uniref:hypothetical protein n=1 Tax=Desulfosediminicola flagellatus TaxID=2569541 RepID=UPI0010ACF17F|nr:hypothetical protein [Desulfosediminicola flagellatus]